MGRQTACVPTVQGGVFCLKLHSALVFFTFTTHELYEVTEQVRAFYFTVYFIVVAAQGRVASFIYDITPDQRYREHVLPEPAQSERELLPASAGVPLIDQRDPAAPAQPPYSSAAARPSRSTARRRSSNCEADPPEPRPYYFRLQQRLRVCGFTLMARVKVIF